MVNLTKHYGTLKKAFEHYIYSIIDDTDPRYSIFKDLCIQYNYFELYSDFPTTLKFVLKNDIGIHVENGNDPALAYPGPNLQYNDYGTTLIVQSTDHSHYPYTFKSITYEGYIRSIGMNKRIPVSDLYPFFIPRHYHGVILTKQLPLLTINK